MNAKIRTLSTSAMMTMAMTSLSIPASAAMPVTVSCEALKGLSIPALVIGLATKGATVTSSVTVSSNDATSGAAHCLVMGEIYPLSASETIHPNTVHKTDVNTPSILFRVALPNDWNHKTLQYGGGGFNGTIPQVDRASEDGIQNALARGYATLASDSGHKAPYAGGNSNELWNSEALRNFGRQQIKKTHDAAQFILATYYHATPQHSYFQGGSQGGHEALIAAQFYPDDYDGVIAGYPAYNLEAMHLGSMDYGKTLYNARTAGVDGYQFNANAGEGWISRPQTRALTRYMLDTCDAKDLALDGASDDMISDAGACQEFITQTLGKNLLAHDDSNPLRCEAGVHSRSTAAKVDQETCLSDPQIETLARIGSRYNLPDGLVLSGGLKSYGRWPMLDGIHIAKDDTVHLSQQEDFGSERGAFDAFQATFPSIDQYNIITQKTYSKPADILENFDPANWVERITTLSRWVDTSGVDFSHFRGKGGKMIHYHGGADVSITPYNSIDFYLRMTGQFKGNKDYLGTNAFWRSDDAATNDRASQNESVGVSGGVVDDFYSFYLIPGYGHGKGYYKASVDWLSALEHWVEQDIAPVSHLVSTDVSGNQLGRRPLCYFPYYPQYVGGSSDTTLASDYECRKLTDYQNLM